MKTIVILGTCLASILTQAAFAEDEYFHRKPGLWEISMTTESHPGKTNPIKYCLDEKTDAELLKLGQSVGQQCTKHEMHRDGSTFTSNSTCNMMGTTIESKAVFSGDFSANYQGDIFATYNPPLMGKTSSRMKVTGRWLGACEAGQQPGDMIMANGMKMNLSQMKNMAKGALPNHRTN